MSIYQFQVKTIDGKETTLEPFRGKILLIVNVASHCGFTKQYAGLEALYQKYQSKGLVVLGFPCNQFGGQEPGREEEIKNFCTSRFQVTFPLFSKIDVNGKNTHPLFAFLKKEEKGVLGTEAIKWNFTKFLVDGEGRVLKRYSSQAEPDKIGKELEEIFSR